MKRIFYINSFLIAAMLSFAATSCATDENTNENSDPEILLTENSTYGKILTDLEGNTLYFFSEDPTGETTCYDSCSSTWPTYYNSSIGANTVPDGLDASDFGTIDRTDGGKQTTYKGWPLYYFSGDNAAGETNGENVGSVWFVAKPDYSIMIAKGPLLGKNGNYYETTNYESYTVAASAVAEFYFTDADGNTLYAYQPDTSDTNTYSATDSASIWPVYAPDSTAILVPTGVSASDFGSVSVTPAYSGETVNQLTYKGWPMYYYSVDGPRGDVLGISVPSAPETQTGNVAIWPVFYTDTMTAP